MAYVHRGFEACAGRQGRRVVSAFVATAFAQDDAEGAEPSGAPDQLRPKLLKLAAFLDEAEADDRHRLPSAVALQQSDTLSLYGGA